MEKKTIDLSKSVFDIVSAYPEVKDIMSELGFYWNCEAIHVKYNG